MQIIKNSHVILILIVILAFGLRLHGIDNPVADWHSWRQADTSAVSRNYVKWGIDLLHPRFDDLSNIPSGKDNPQGFRFVEFPLYNLESVIFYNIFPFLNVEEWGRLVTVFASLGTLIFLYLLVGKNYGRRAGLLSAFFFAVLPYNVYYSRTILPDPHLVFATTGAVYFFDKWLEKNKLSYWLFSVIFFAAGLLFKTYAVFLVPVFIYQAYAKNKFRAFLSPANIFFALISFLPLALWRFWMLRYPEGIPAYVWLFNSNGIRFRPAFFRWIFYERLTKLILGFSGLAFLLPGIFKRLKNETWLFYIWAGCIGLYVSVIATGNVQHDYYQIFTIPIICVFLGKGLDFLINFAGHNKYKNLLLGTCALSLIFMEYYGWQTVKTYYWINNRSIIEAGKAVDKLTPKDAKIIAPYGGDTAFLYQTNRQGWPQGFEIPEKIKKGARYYVNINLNDPETQYVMKNWKVIKKTEKYVIVKLN